MFAKRVPLGFCQMPIVRPHEAGLQAARDPPLFEDYTGRPVSEWHDAQDNWIATFSEGKSSLPPPAENGSAESKSRARAWKNALKRFLRAKCALLADSGDAEFRAILNAESDRKLLAIHRERQHEDGSTWYPRPRGPAPAGYTWCHLRGKWFNVDGEPRPFATRNKRRVDQRDASEVQSLRHKHKWALYDSSERRSKRQKGIMPLLTSAEAKTCNAAWRLRLPGRLSRPRNFLFPSPQISTKKFQNLRSRPVVPFAGLPRDISADGIQFS